MTLLEAILRALLSPASGDDGPAHLDLLIGSQILHTGGPIVAISKAFVIGDGPAVLTLRASRKGKPSRIDPPVAVEVVDPSLFSAEVLPDGLSVRFRDLGVPGSTEATITADVAIGPEVRSQSITIGLTAVEGEADLIDGEFGDQEPESEPEPDEPTPEPTP